MNATHCSDSTPASSVNGTFKALIARATHRALTALEILMERINNPPPSQTDLFGASDGGCYERTLSENKEPMSVYRAASLHESTLMDTIHCCASEHEGSPRHVADMFIWMFEPEQHALIRINGAVSYRPLSYWACCQAFSADPVTFRELFCEKLKIDHDEVARIVHILYDRAQESDHG